MVESERKGGPRVFKAVWAADEDWKASAPQAASQAVGQEAGWALRQYNKLAARIEAAASRVEEEVLPWGARFKRLPLCALRAVPLVAGLIALYWLAALVVSWVTSASPAPLAAMALFAHWVQVVWMGVVLAVLVGYREARYREGLFRPSFSHLLGYLRSNWWMVLPAIAIMSFVGLDSETRDEPMALQIFTISFLTLAIFWVSDLTAYKPRQGKV